MGIAGKRVCPMNHHQAQIVKCGMLASVNTQCKQLLRSYL
jgi:hypothetical protein